MELVRTGEREVKFFLDTDFLSQYELNETDINPPAELGRLADASGDKQSTRIKTPVV